MRDNVLWRKKSHLVIMLAQALGIDQERALSVFYSTNTCKMLSDPKYGLHLMSDGYLLEDVLNEVSSSRTAGVRDA